MLLRLLQVNSTVLLGLGLGGLVLAVIYWAVKVRRPPSTEFAFVLVGMLVGFLFHPPDQGHRTTFGAFQLVFWVIGGAIGGGLIGMLMARLEKRLDVQSRRSNRKKAAPELSDEF